jgi:hypothetical protein
LFCGIDSLKVIVESGFHPHAAGARGTRENQRQERDPFHARIIVALRALSNTNVEGLLSLSLSAEPNWFSANQSLHPFLPQVME